MRFFLYVALILFSLVLFCLSAARLYYTTHLSGSDPLNAGVAYYDPVVVLLLVTALFTMVIAPFFAMTIRRGYSHARVTRIWFEVIVLFILWLMLLVGAAIASSIWPNLMWCNAFEPCRVLQALLAFAWMTWLIMSALMVSMVIFAVQYRAWDDHIHSYKWGNGRREVY